MGKAPLTCHCEAPQEPWQSRSTRRNTGKPRRIRKCLFEIAASGLRPPRNDTGGRHSQVCPCAPPGEAGYQICHCEAPQEPWQSRSTRLEHRKAPAKSQLPPRDSHVASLLGMTRLGGAVVYQCPLAVEYSPTAFSSGVPSKDPCGKFAATRKTPILNARMYCSRLFRPAAPSCRQDRRPEKGGNLRG